MKKECDFEKETDISKGKLKEVSAELNEEDNPEIMLVTLKKE